MKNSKQPPRSRSWFVHIILVALTFYLLLGCQSKQPLTQTFQGYNYTINFSEDWEAEEQQGFIVLFHDKNQDKAQLATVNIQALGTAKVGGKYANLTEAYDDFKKQILATSKQATFSNETVYQRKNIRGEMLVGKQFIATYQYEGLTFKQWQIMLPNYDGRFILSWGYTAIDEHYDAYYPMAEKMLQTWQIN